MDYNYSNESSEDEYDEVLFMGIERKIPEEEVEGVLDLRKLRNIKHRFNQKILMMKKHFLLKILREVLVGTKRN